MQSDGSLEDYVGQHRGLLAEEVLLASLEHRCGPVHLGEVDGDFRLGNEIRRALGALRSDLLRLRETLYGRTRSEW